MGNNQAYGLHHQVVETLKTETKFSEGEISDLYRQFRLDAKALTMNSAHFTEMYRSVYPHGQPENLAERVFATFDQRKDGKVDFHEFLSALNVQLKGTIKMKYEWVFDVIDHKTRGNVEGENIREVIKVLDDLNAGVLPANYQSVDAYFDRIMRSIGTLEGPVTKKEFVNAALSDGAVSSLAESVVKAALMPYEMRRQRTGSYGRARADSIRARAMTNQQIARNTNRIRTNTVI